MAINFRDLPVQDLEGVTRNFEQLRAVLLTGVLQGETLGGALTGELPNPKLAAPEAWKLLSTLTYKNGWEDLEAANKGEYRKNPFGNVELRGALKGGTPAKEGFTLPAGYRPKAQQEFIVASGANTGLVRIFTTGVVELFSLAGEAKTSIYLDQVNFSVE